MRNIKSLLFKALISCLIITASQFCLATNSDSSEYIRIDRIEVLGNKKTKKHIILREFDFAVGDSIKISDTLSVFEATRNKVFNIGLFVVCDYEVFKTFDNNYSFILIVKENWYIWPIPHIDLGDRNFNEWWQERDKDFSRLIYGIHFRNDNFRGRNEKLKLKLEFGFTRKYELFYAIPYINKKRTSGIGFGISYSENKLVAFRTFKHKLAYINTDKNLRKRFYVQGNFLHRSKYYANHKITGRININSIEDTVSQLNTNYFGDAVSTQNYFSLTYSFSYDRRDIQYYPLKGHFLYFIINKDGLGVFKDLDMTRIITGASKYYSLSKKIFAGHHVQFKLSNPTSQPYYNTRGLGYGEQTVRGFELYVIDGQHYVHNRNELKFRLLETRQEYGIVPIEQFQTIPLSIYLTGFIDYGYVIDNTFNPDNRFLSNRSMLGYGVGLNLVTFYDSVIRLEVSRNDLNETGLFFHIDASF